MSLRWHRVLCLIESSHGPVICERVSSHHNYGDEDSETTLGRGKEAKKEKGPVFKADVSYYLVNEWR